MQIFSGHRDKSNPEFRVIHSAISSFHKVLLIHSEIGITIKLSGGSMSANTLFEFIRGNLEEYGVDPNGQL